MATNAAAAMPRSQHDGGNGRLDAVQQPGHRRHLPESHVAPTQRNQQQQRRQHEQAAGYQPTGGAVHQPADVGGQLLCFRTWQHHAVIQRVQKALLGNPAPLFDQFAVHQRNLPGRAAKADAAQLQPIRGGFSQRGLGWCGLLRFFHAPTIASKPNRQMAFRCRAKIRAFQ